MSLHVLVADGFAEPTEMMRTAEQVLRERGHSVTHLGLVEAGFDQFMSAAERAAYHEVDNLITPEQRESAELLRTHDAILIGTPLRSGMISPVVKSWFERVFIPEVSFTFSKSGRVVPSLRRFKRLGMVVGCPDADPAPHRRGYSTRANLRTLRFNGTTFCRTSYITVTPDDDIDATIRKGLARW